MIIQIIGRSDGDDRQDKPRQLPPMVTTTGDSQKGERNEFEEKSEVGELMMDVRFEVMIGELVTNELILMNPSHSSQILASSCASPLSTQKLGDNAEEDFRLEDILKYLANDRVIAKAASTALNSAWHRGGVASKGGERVIKVEMEGIRVSEINKSSTLEVFTGIEITRTLVLTFYLPARVRVSKAPSNTSSMPIRAICEMNLKGEECDGKFKEYVERKQGEIFEEIR